MLLEFRTKNYKSIRDEAVLSFVASKDKTFDGENTRSTGIKSIPKVTTSAAIYGANASGKSNLVNAISYMSLMVEKSSNLAPDHTFNIQPFRLDAEKLQEATEFEITFVIDSVRYQYGFCMTSDRITEEWLLVYKTAKAQNWFTRYYDEETNEDIYKFGPGLTGPKEVWRHATRHNSLFLSTAIQLNNTQLQPLYYWIVKNIVVIGAHGQIPPDPTMNAIQSEIGKKKVVSFLSSADISISDIDIEKRKGLTHRIHFNGDKGTTETKTEEAETLEPKFTHSTDAGTARFELHEESLGTQRLFSLAGPLLEILNEGKLLIFDELNNSLHTLLAQKLVQMFHDPDINMNGSQLLFTTHDTAILDTSLLRRDQIWLVEKDTNQASSFYPLTDFSPRKSESLERGYLMGRYGAIPFLSGFGMGIGGS